MPNDSFKPTAGVGLVIKQSSRAGGGLIQALGVISEPVAMNDNMPLAAAHYLNGVNFRKSADELRKNLAVDGQDKPTQLTAIPLYFLASHAAELYLKAALLKRGVSAADLKAFEYRHNLSALLKLLKSKGVFVSSETAEIVDGLSKQHEITHFVIPCS